MYRVDVTHQKDFSFTAKSADGEFAIDIKGAGMTPPDTLLASLAGCVGVYIRKYAEGAKLPLEHFVVSAEAQLSKEPPVRFSSIKVSVDLKGAQLDERRRYALMEFIRNCPVHHTITGSPDVDIALLSHGNQSPSEG